MFRKLRRAEAARPLKDDEEKKPAAKTSAAPGKRAGALPSSKEQLQPSEPVPTRMAKPAASEKTPTVERSGPKAYRAAPAASHAAPGLEKPERVEEIAARVLSRASAAVETPELSMRLVAPAAEKAAPAAKKAAAAVGKSEPEGVEGAPQERARQLLADLEARVGRAMGLLEAQASALSGALAKAQAPLAPEPRVGASQDYLDEVTAAFRRAVGEALDRKLEEFLAPLVGLHGKLGDGLRLLEEDSRGPKHGDLKAALADAISELEKILRAFGGSFIAPKAGECYDPLIHLAVAEEPSSGGPESVVACVLRPGYKTSRGKVVLPARVLVARR